MTSLKAHLKKIWSKLTAMYGYGVINAIALIVGFAIILSISLFTFFNIGAPTTLTITSGEAGSVFQEYAEQYKKILAKEGVILTILPSDGSIDNLNKLSDTRVKVDVGFVQSGVADGANVNHLMSLGSIAYQPIMIFYRGKNKRLISEFKGQRLNIGETGSGTQALALLLLKENGILPNGNTKLIETLSLDPMKDLLEDKVDALFVMGDSTSIRLIRTLIQTPGINIYNFTQADGYTRKSKFLHKLVLPEGALDLGKNIPSSDLNLIAPSVELIVRKNLHPALSDLLLDAAHQVHNASGLFVKSGEFPNGSTQEFNISPDATRYYKSGKSILYRNFPYWMASLFNRILVILVPLLLILIPAIRMAPSIYKWSIQLRIYPFYKALLELERTVFAVNVDDTKRQQILTELDQLELNLSRIKIPAAFGDLFYGLRGHINFVRIRLMADKVGDSIK